MHKVHLLPKAEKFFARAETNLAKKLASCFELLESDPKHHPNIKNWLARLKAYIAYAPATIGSSIGSTRKRKSCSC
jgi:mRNA interferase RelE/StbE